MRIPPRNFSHLVHSAFLSLTVASIPTDAQRDDVQSNVWAIIFQLSGAVAYCHNREKKVSSIDYGEDDEHIMGSSEVYHRDIKPQNGEFGPHMSANYHIEQI